MFWGINAQERILDHLNSSQGCRLLKICIPGTYTRPAEDKDQESIF